MSWSCARTRTSSCRSRTWIWKCVECPSPIRREKLCGCGGTGVTPPLLKRHRTHEQSGSGSVNRPGEGSTAASKPEVIDVEMQDDPSIPYENIVDTEMDPGFFEGEAPMEIEQGLVEGNEAVGMDLGYDLPRMGDLFDEASELPMRAPRRLEQVLHPRLDVPEGLVPAKGEEKAPKLVRLVNSVLISKYARFPESLKMCGSQVWLAKPSSVLSEVDGCPLDVQLAIEGRRTELVSMDSHKAGRIVSADEARSFASTHGVRIIPTRWVIGPKMVNGKEAVRARCVVQDVAKGSIRWRSLRLTCRLRFCIRHCRGMPRL